jgi:Caspase domain
MRRVALLVGNSKFADGSGIANLRFPSADVQAMDAVLSDEDIGRFDRVVPLIDGSRDAILTFLNSILDEERGAIFFFYYSGHGKVSDRGRLFLAASDTNERLLAATGVPFASILEMKDDFGCARFCAVLDCCFAGLGTENIKGSTDERLKAFAEGKGVFFLGAANATTVAREDPDLGHGILTAAILDGLKSGLADVDNDGRVTGPDLFSWCRDFAVKRGANKPVQVNRVEDDDLVIAFSPRRLSVAMVEAARLKLRALWENELLPGEDIDRLRAFLRASSLPVLSPSPNTLEADFLAHVDRTIDFNEFWRRRMARTKTEIASDEPPPPPRKPKRPVPQPTVSGRRSSPAWLLSLVGAVAAFVPTGALAFVISSGVNSHTEEELLLWALALCSVFSGALAGPLRNRWGTVRAVFVTLPLTCLAMTGGAWLLSWMQGTSTIGLFPLIFIFSLLVVGCIFVAIPLHEWLFKRLGNSTRRQAAS